MSNEELQKAKKAFEKEKDKFAAWLYKKLEESPRGTITKLALFLKKSQSRVSEYKNGTHYPSGDVRQKMKIFFKRKT